MATCTELTPVSMSDTEEGLRRACLASPMCATPRLILADYLDDNDRPFDAALERSRAALLTRLQQWTEGITKTIYAAAEALGVAMSSCAKGVIELATSLEEIDNEESTAPPVSCYQRRPSITTRRPQSARTPTDTRRSRYEPQINYYARRRC